MATPPLNSAGQASGQSFVGNYVQGSYYVEIDLKMNAISPSSNASWPAWWQENLDVERTNGSDGAQFPWIEFDMMECTTTSSGNPCSPQMNIHEWVSNGGNPTIVGNTQFTPSLGTVDWTTYHTLGFRLVKSTSNGGTGLIDFYFDNIDYDSCTYTSSAAVCNGVNIGATRAFLTLPIMREIFSI